jgi:hypothetical protein
MSKIGYCCPECFQNDGIVAPVFVGASVSRCLRCCSFVSSSVLTFDTDLQKFKLKEERREGVARYKEQKELCVQVPLFDVVV